MIDGASADATALPFLVLCVSFGSGIGRSCAVAGSRHHRSGVWGYEVRWRGEFWVWLRWGEGNLSSGRLRWCEGTKNFATLLEVRWGRQNFIFSFDIKWDVYNFLKLVLRWGHVRKILLNVFFFLFCGEVRRRQTLMTFLGDDNFLFFIYLPVYLFSSFYLRKTVGREENRGLVRCRWVNQLIYTANWWGKRSEPIHTVFGKLSSRYLKKSGFCPKACEIKLLNFRTAFVTSFFYPEGRWGKLA